MGYESADLFQFDGKTWAIARGEACGSYPADPYNTDILALKFELRRPIKRGRTKRKTEKQIQEELSETIKRSSYFRNSLICGMADGRLTLTENGRFTESMLRLLQPRISDFIAQNLETRTDVIHTDLRPVVSKAVEYKPEFVDFLVETIETVLKET